MQSFPKLSDDEKYQMNLLEMQTLRLHPRGTKSQSPGKGSEELVNQRATVNPTTLAGAC